MVATTMCMKDDDSKLGEELLSERKEVECLRHKKLSVGDRWYLVDYHWFQQYCRFTDKALGESLQNPGPIDNNFLLQLNKETESVTLKHDLTENHDFIMLPEEAWQKLKKRFGVADAKYEIGRSVIECGITTKQLTVELRPLILQVHFINEAKTDEILISRASSIDNFFQLIANSFDKSINMTNARLFFMHSHENFELVNCSNYKTLEDAGFYSGQKIFVDLKKSDDTWSMDETKTPQPVLKTTFSKTNPISHQSPLPAVGLHPSPSSSYVGRTTVGFMNMGSSSQTLISSASTENFNKKMPPTGLCGLNNFGNTCFMNSALQCMSNTPPLSEYFVSGQYEAEINEVNPLGMRGEMARTFGDLMKQMWSHRNQLVTPRNFKTTVGRFAPQFSGYQQQDSQELLAFLLDGLHEDLNRVRQKPYVECKDYDGLCDAEAAEESWKNYKLRNDSVVVDLFHGLLKSTLVCPVCSKRSVTFDPFCYLSLPLLIKRERQINVLFVPLNPQDEMIQCQITVIINGTIKDVADGLQKLIDKDTSRLIFCELYCGNQTRLCKIFSFMDELTGIPDRDTIVAYEIPEFLPNERSIRLVIYNRISRKSGFGSSTLVGFPLLIVLRDKDFNYSSLREILRTATSRFVNWANEEVGLNPQNDNENDSGLDENGDSNMDDVSGAGSRQMAPESTDSMADNDDVFRMILTNCFGSSEVGPVQPLVGDEPLAVPSSGNEVYVCLEWKQRFEKYFYKNHVDAQIKKHASATLNLFARKSIQLSECLELFATTERLGKHDLWYCPQCKIHQEATKKFDLWNVPDILIIHLKRFSYDSYFRNKIEILVDFPLEKLNVRPWIVNSNAQDALYDLIAVSNHYGGLGGGHYTAYAKNKYSDRWYLFDDARVTVVDDSEVVSKGAYVLVYAKRHETASVIPADPNFEMEGGESD